MNNYGYLEYVECWLSVENELWIWIYTFFLKIQFYSSRVTIEIIRSSDRMQSGFNSTETLTSNNIQAG